MNENRSITNGLTAPQNQVIRPCLFDVHDDFASGAEFSPCRTWRYVLWRRWNWQGYANQVMFIGLNPSTADEREDDPTIRRCIRFAKDWGYGGLLMMNAFAFRATDPKDMKAAIDPIGPGNDEAFGYRRTQVGLIVAAWGAYCPLVRAECIHEALGYRPVMCLGVNKDGTPKHPLYLKATTKPQPFMQRSDKT